MQPHLADLLFDLCSLTNSAAEVIKLAAANLTASNNIDLVNNRRMDRENPFNAAAVSYAPYSKGLIDPSVFLGNNSTLKNLDPVLFAFLDLYVYLNGITNVYDRNVLFKTAVADELECVHKLIPPKFKDILTFRKQPQLNSGIRQRTVPLMSATDRNT